jgi:hypothetical protein
MKTEPFLAELNRLRQDVDHDEADMEYLTLHHAFCFISYKMNEFTSYLDEAEQRGEFKALKHAATE